MNYGNERAAEAASAVGIPNGRMMSFSKSFYRETYPDHLAVFNATIADESGVGLWWGDLDVTRDEPALTALAAALGTRLLVFYEGQSHLVDPERWVFEVAQATFLVDPVAGVTVADRVAEHVERDGAGRLVRREPGP